MWRDGGAGGYRSRMTPTWLDHVLVLCFAVLLPLRGATVGYRRLAALDGDATSARKRFYLRSLLLHGLMLLATLVIWLTAGRSWAQLGLGVPDPWLVLVGLAAAFLGLGAHYY